MYSCAQVALRFIIRSSVLMRITFLSTTTELLGFDFNSGARHEHASKAVNKHPAVVIAFIIP